jgi:serine/threonine protein kinase
MTIPKYSAFFSPPEYFEDEEQNFKSDVWSLGCLLYFIVTDMNPWEDETRISIFNNVRQYLK